MPRIVLSTERAYSPGVHTLPVAVMPNIVDGGGRKIPGTPDFWRCDIRATRPAWPASGEVLRVDVYANYHPDREKWQYLIGFTASGGPTDEGYSSVRRKLKPARVCRIRTVLTVLQPVSTELSVEFTGGTEPLQELGGAQGNGNRI